MAGLHKYAGLPDVEDNAQEVYETTLPDLTEASTIPTQSDSSDHDHEDANFDRGTLNPDAARRRFEPSLVDARHADFSDTIAGQRAAYRTGRRRRRPRPNRTRALDQRLSDSSDLSDQETLQVRVARLRREAEEVKAELEQLEKRDEHKLRDTDKITGDEDGDSAYEDAVDRGSQDGQKLNTETEVLDKLLRGLTTKTSGVDAGAIDQAFLSRLSDPAVAQERSWVVRQDHSLSPSTISAIAAFSDRLTALESVLGLPASTTTRSSPILPTLTLLTTQVETLAATLAPPPEVTTTSTGTSVLDSTIHLQPLFQRIRDLNDEVKALAASNRTASKSFEELMESRDRHRRGSSKSNYQHNRHTDSQRDTAQTSPERTDAQAQFEATFLESHASRITALHALLPTITQLQPLLPIVLERLRTLSRIHTGAAESRAELDEAERRTDELEDQVKTWSQAVDRVEKAMAQGQVVMKENVATIAEMVREVEEKCRQLER